MPQYKVLAPGFFNGRYYHPTGKRRTLSTDTPFPKKKMPSWLGPMPKESEANRKKREAYEAAEAEAAEQKAKQDQEDIDNASFMGEGESADSSGVVETL